MCTIDNNKTSGDKLVKFNYSSYGQLYTMGNE